MKLFLRKWQTAYRARPQGSIFTDKETPFAVIHDKIGYTAADPFLFSDNGVTYLFAELYEEKTGLGRLGYSVYDGKKFSEWRVVISENYHLSYPNIFRYNDEIYIVPESSKSNTLYAYRAVEFPDKWEKLSPPIIDNRMLVDTTFLEHNGRHLMFTYDIKDYENSKLYLYSVDDNGNVEEFVKGYISDDVSSARPGGNFFEYNGDIIRVSQDCTGDYGVAVVFSKVEKCSSDGYKEKKIMRISPDDIKLGKKFISGIHTYNANEELEVIDFHITDFNPIWRIIRKLGLKK